MAEHRFTLEGIIPVSSSGDENANPIVVLYSKKRNLRIGLPVTHQDAFCMASALQDNPKIRFARFEATALLRLCESLDGAVRAFVLNRVVQGDGWKLLVGSLRISRADKNYCIPCTLATGCTVAVLRGIPIFIERDLLIGIIRKHHTREREMREAQYQKLLDELPTDGTKN